ncbi:MULTISPECIES: hypothetical protein [unclassified Streptomyces]|uniref:hypothetical protein n=1 Tax=unclassified Streptomyces TaxID=2593676 RepID=UPI001F25B1C6|nr:MULTISPECIES: hypothetical protein [unclassified Streptomyces]
MVAAHVRAAEDAAEALRGGLAGVGVVLPGLRIVPASCLGDAPVPLVDLGRCDLGTALRLAAVLAVQEGAGDDVHA